MTTDEQTPAAPTAQPGVGRCTHSSLVALVERTLQKHTVRLEWQPADAMTEAKWLVEGRRAAVTLANAAGYEISYEARVDSLGRIYVRPQRPPIGVDPFRSGRKRRSRRR